MSRFYLCCIFWGQQTRVTLILSISRKEFFDANDSAIHYIHSKSPGGEKLFHLTLRENLLEYPSAIISIRFNVVNWVEKINKGKYFGHGLGVTLECVNNFRDVFIRQVLLLKPFIWSVWRVLSTISHCVNIIFILFQILFQRNFIENSKGSFFKICITYIKRIQ